MIIMEHDLDIIEKHIEYTKARLATINADQERARIEALPAIIQMVNDYITTPHRGHALLFQMLVDLGFAHIDIINQVTNNMINTCQSIIDSTKPINDTQADNKPLQKSRNQVHVDNTVKFIKERDQNTNEYTIHELAELFDIPYLKLARITNRLNLKRPHYSTKRGFIDKDGVRRYAIFYNENAFKRLSDFLS